MSNSWFFNVIYDIVVCIDLNINQSILLVVVFESLSRIFFSLEMFINECFGITANSLRFFFVTITINSLPTNTFQSFIFLLLHSVRSKQKLCRSQRLNRRQLQIPPLHRLIRHHHSLPPPTAQRLLGHRGNRLIINGHRHP